MEEFYIEFDTETEPGKLGAIKVSIGFETITDMERPLNIALCDHPLYSRLAAYVKANPAR
jgi:hypothetical protein